MIDPTAAHPTGGDLLLAKLAIIGMLGIGAQWLAWRLQQPAIVLLTVAGLAIGPVASILFGEPFLDPQHDFGDLYRPMIALAVAVILFDGGLALDFRELRDKEARTAVRRLVFVGAPLGWLLGALAARYAAGLPWWLAILLGGLLVVTGPTVILPLLRQAKLSARPASTLKWESIVNDPVGALFAVFAFEVLRLQSAGAGWMGTAVQLVFGSAVGGFLGLAAGLVLAQAFRRGLVPEYLKAPVVLAAVLGCFVAADSVAHETGLLAVTVFGMTLANARLAAIEDMRRFKETIATVLVSGVFVILTASLTPEAIAALDWRAAAFVLAMLFVVRPITIMTATHKSGLTLQERALVSWIAPRGVVAVAVSGFFAAELVALGQGGINVPMAQVERLAPITFALVIVTIIAHGFTIGPLSRRLGLAKTGPEGVLIVGASQWSIGLAKALDGLGVAVTVADNAWPSLRRARLEGLTTFHGEVLSEAADHRLDHARFGWVIAATRNDAYNALVCVEFGPEVGRHRVWQLPDMRGAESSERGIAFTARGRTLIDDKRGHYKLIEDWFTRGWRFRTTRLSEEYTLRRFRDERGEHGDLIAQVRDGRLSLLGPGVSPRDEPGSVVLWYGPPRSDAASRSEEPVDPAVVDANSSVATTPS